MTSPHPVLTSEKLLHMVRTSEKTPNVDLISLSVKPGTADGENYSSELLAVDIVADVDGVRKSLHWMAKLPPAESGRKPVHRALRMEEKEIGFYVDLLPRMRAHVGEGKDVELNFCAAPYAEFHEDVSDGSILAMQNLQYLGYSEAANKKKGLGVEYCKLVLSELAKMHAVSRSMFQAYPGGLSEGLEKNRLFARDFAYSESDEMFQQVKDAMKKPLSSMMFNFLEASQDEGQDFVGELRRFVDERGGDVLAIRDGFFKADPEGFNVICHGDAWFNNMMFKHEGEVPVKASLVDVSVFRWGNPCTDLCHFFFISTTFEFRKKHLQELLQHYHQVLTSTFSKLGNDPNVYPLNQLLEDYNRHCPLSFLTSMLILPGCLARKEDTLTQEDMRADWSNAEEVGAMMKRVIVKARRSFDTEPHMKVVIVGNFMDMVERGYFKI